jgi:phosphoribosylglycinamide formyltransferase-1
MKIISFLASGRGSNFLAVAKAMAQGQIQGKPGILITSNKVCSAVQLAAELNFPCAPLSWKDEGGQSGFEARALTELKRVNTDLIVCAGYMKILSSRFISSFKNRIINIHPALLPSFPGANAQKQAIEYGVRVSGCTVHFVDEGVDTGPIILQKTVLVNQNDDAETLSSKIIPEEHKTLIQAVQLFCQDKLSIQGRKVLISH